MNPVVGIDLGTTYSAISYINKHGKPEIIPNREGERVTPSVVLFDGETPIVGSIAKRSAASSPLNFCQFVKRQMGNPDWRFPTEGGASYSPEEVSAFILKRLKEDAETAIGCPITDAVITVPAYFNDAQRKATQDAGRVAGLNVLRIVNEPTAAALAYGIEQEQDQTVMVYDLGGGTFDITVLRLTSGEIEVIATDGDKNLGGFDWDNRVMLLLNERFQELGGSNLMDLPETEQDLRDKAEIAKKTLSSRDTTKVFLACGGKSQSVTLTRDDFERATRDLLKRTSVLMEGALEDSRLGWGDISKLLLVGGSTRMPAVSTLVESVSGRRPSCELHPDEAVALGAALIAGIEQRKRLTADTPAAEAEHLAGLPAVRFSEVNSHSLGVIAIHGITGREFNSIILPRNSKIPTTASQVYSTVRDYQDTIEVLITEGEEEAVEEVHVIGSAKMSIPRYPCGAPVEVCFQYDDNGMVHVRVVDKTAGARLGEMNVDRRSNRTEAQVNEMRLQVASVEVQ